jgi:RNA polymerase sigma-70 factor, ECF subfamily
LYCYGEPLVIDEKIVLEKCRQGDPDAIRRIYQAYADDLVTLAMNLLGDGHAAEDVVQDVFIRFVQSVPRIRQEGKLKSYLASCVANRARDLYRTRLRQSTVNLDDTQWLASKDHGPVRLLENHEHMAAIGQAVEKLPYEQRETVMLRLQGELTFRQIACLQGVSIKTVLSRYRYGLEKLRHLVNGRVEI